MRSTVNILLIEDHPLYRNALTPVIRQLAQTVNISEAACITDAFTIIERQPRFDLVLLDLTLPDAMGLKALLPVCQLLPDVPVVIISANENRNLMVHAFNAGAKGYIPKSADSSVIKSALMLVLSGEVYIPSIALDSLSSGLSLLEEEAGTSLTGRQEEVLQSLAQGYSNKQIGNILNIAETTVRVHVSDIIHLLHAHNRTDAVVKAQQLGLVNSVH